ESTRRLNATTSQATTPRTQDDIEIVKLSSKCTKVAEDLLAELRKLGLEQSGLRHTITKIVQVARQKALLKEKQDLLEKYRRVLDARILIRLDARSLRDTQDIKSLEQGVQALALGLQQGHNTVAQLLADRNSQLQEHIDMKFDSHAKATEDRLSHTRLLESLFFPEIVSREEQIPEAFEGTCRWIFDSSDDRKSRTRPWSNFCKWLETENGVYWISGKPGSGKSTLMKYIVTNDRTPQLLAEWEKGTDLIVISFFFWNAGMALQKSCTGLLRSLLYQIATQWPALANLVASPTGRSKDAIEASRSWTPLTTWTDHGLMSLLNRFLNEKPANISLCAFVDGLDEFVGDEEYLLHMIELFNNSSRCKICVSSRPEQAFPQEFRLCSQLRVQDLNREDIERTATGKLRPSLQKHSVLPIAESDVRSLVDALVKMASGVFLWLDLMTKDLIRGSRDGDTLEELHSRLATTPDTINGLYAHLLQKLDPLYVEDCVRYCSILIMAEDLKFRTPITLLALAMGGHEPWSHLVDFDLAYFAESQFSSVCQVLETRLTSRCGGLLEIDNHRHEATDQKATMHYFHRKVDFVHRTAPEYVQTAYEIPSIGSSALLEAQALVARGIIGTYIISDTGYDLHDRLGLPRAVGDSMLSISTMSSSAVPPDNDRPAKPLQIGLVNQVCQTLQNLYDFHNPNPAKQLFFDDHDFLDRLVMSFRTFRRDWIYYLLNSRLGIAAYFGCHHYVQSCLSTKTFSADRMSALLKGAIVGFGDLMSRFPPRFCSVFLPRLLTIQAILRCDLNLNLNLKEYLYWGDTEFYELPELYATLYGRLFYLLMFASNICRHSPSTTVQQKYTNMQQQFTERCLELTQQLLSIGANPNTRLILKTHFLDSTCIDCFSGFIDVSLLSMLEMFQVGNAEMEACIRSAGAIHYKRIRFVKYESIWYPTNDVQSQRLDQVSMNFELVGDLFLWSPKSGLRGSASVVEAAREVLKSIAENHPMSEEEVHTAIKQSYESV
ncbi:MAG: hypothetical protein L6R38_008160, partial [Xanthoria sp. 2 TBL-2021]